MSADLHARIAAAVAEWRERVQSHGWVTGMRHPYPVGHLILAACDHADDVLARHPTDPDSGSCRNCWGVRAPCPEVRSLADWLLGKGNW